ncbi:MAG: hypothetical protein IJZ67_04075 [Alistipes sp.]|nr:hypothetical protein [Alistipes sp.]
MRKIFFAIIALAALVGCNTDMMEEVATTPQYLTTSLEVALDDQTRAYDENLKWSWESTDKIAALQLAGENTVNALTLNDNGKFFNNEFKYATEEPTTFVFVYPYDAYIDAETIGYVQTGKWTPTLVGTVEATTVDNIGNESIAMEHHSAAFEIRVWDENKTDRKAISAATITSESDFCNGTTASVDNLNTDTVVFNIAAGDFAFNLTLTATDGTTYTVEVPQKNFALGKRTILNVQWKSVSLDGVSSWYDEVYNGKDSQLEGGYIYLNGFEGASAQVYVNNEPATVVDNKIAVATGTYTVYAAVGANKTAEYTVTVTGKPSISYTATTSYNNNAGTVLKNNTLTNGNEGKLLTISNYSCNIAAEDAPYFGTPVFVYGNNEMAPANKSMELAVGQYNTYVKLPIVGTSHNLKYGEAAMYVTGVPCVADYLNNSYSGWNFAGSLSFKEVRVNVGSVFRPSYNYYNCAFIAGAGTFSSDVYNGAIVSPEFGKNVSFGVTISMAAQSRNVDFSNMDSATYGNVYLSAGTKTSTGVKSDMYCTSTYSSDDNPVDDAMNTYTGAVSGVVVSPSAPCLVCYRESKRYNGYIYKIKVEYTK